VLPVEIGKNNFLNLDMKFFIHQGNGVTVTGEDNVKLSKYEIDFSVTAPWADMNLTVHQTNDAEQ
jgi:hypothetical protein